MVLRLEDKKSIVGEVHAIASRSVSAIAAEYRGLTVSELTELRSCARKIDGIHLQVVRNTLARKALEGTSFSCMGDVLVGPILLGFSESDPGCIARLMRDFAKSHEKLAVRAVSLDGKLLEPSRLEDVANLPTREEALAKLLAVMKAPIEKLVRTLAGPSLKLVRVMAAIKDQKSNIT